MSKQLVREIIADALAGARRNTRGRFGKGARVKMANGWSGRVEREFGNTIVCIADGEVPNDYLRGYRAFDIARIDHRRYHDVVQDSSGAHVVIEKTRPAPDQSDVIDLDRMRRQREQERLAATWDAAPS